ncbi:hypothetical protein GEMRC1_005526 [Eukaryota sp. GEM-RC1]
MSKNVKDFPLLILQKAILQDLVIQKLMRGEQKEIENLKQNQTLQLLSDTLESKGEEYLDQLVNVTDPDVDGDIDHNRSNGVIVSYLISSFVLMIVTVIFGIFLFFVLYGSLDNLAAVNLESIETMAVLQRLIVLQRESSALALRFTQFSDMSAFNDYWTLVGSGERQQISEQLTSAMEDPKALELLGLNSYYNDLLFYYERIAIYLAMKADGQDPLESHHLRFFKYDLKNETLYEFNKIQFPTNGLTYTNNVDDALLSPEDQRIVSRSILSGDVYWYYRSRALAVLIELDELLEETVEILLNQVSTAANTDLLFALIIPIIVLILFLGTCGYAIKKLVFFRFRRITFGCIFLSSFCCVFIIVVALIVSRFLAQVNNENDVKLNFEEILNSFEISSQTLSYRASIFTQFGSTVAFVDYFNIPDLYVELKQSGTEILQKYLNFRTIDAYSRALEDLNNLEHLWDRAYHLELISLRLGAEAFELSEYLKNFTEDVTWDVTLEPDFHIQEEIYSYLPSSRLYTNSDDDLSLSKEQIAHLARATVFGPKYYDILDNLEESIGQLRDGFMRRFIRPFTALLQNIQNLVVLLGVLSVVLAISLSCSTLFFYLALTPAKKESSHIKQKIKVDLVTLLTRHYVFALTVIALVLSVFFVLSFITMNHTKHIATELNLAGQRLTLTQEVVTRMAQSISRPVDRELYRLLCNNLLLELQSVHYSLLFGIQGDGTTGSSGRNSLQDSLVFSTKYLENTDNLSSSGLSVLLESFIIIGQQFSTASQGVSFRFDGYHFNQMLIILDRVNAAMLQSIDVYRDEALDLISSFNLYIRLVFGLFLFTLLIIFTTVFKKMISRLKNEEAVTLTLLNNIPESVINEVPLIANYLASRD